LPFHEYLLEFDAVLERVEVARLLSFYFEVGTNQSRFSPLTYRFRSILGHFRKAGRSNILEATAVGGVGGAFLAIQSFNSFRLNKLCSFS